MIDIIERNKKQKKQVPGQQDNHDTIGMLALDRNGNLSGACSTSGMAYKMAGRVGDSPIIGAGLYVDNEVGAAGATGRGEDVIKSCASYYIVLRMKEGRTPQQACEDALQMITDKYRKVNPDYFPPEKFVAINKFGELGCATMIGSSKPRMSVMQEKGFSRFEGTIAFPGKR